MEGPRYAQKGAFKCRQGLFQGQKVWADLLCGALCEEDVHKSLVSVQRGSLGECSRFRLEASMATLLHTHFDGVQAQQGMGQMGRPLLRLGPGKLQNWQRLPKRLQLVGPA